MIVAKDVHDVVRSVSAVENVAQDVEHVDGEPLYQVTERDDEVVGTSGADDAVHNDFHVCLLVGQDGAFVQEFLDDVRELLRQGFSYLRAGVFGRNVLAQCYQSVQGGQIPGIQILFDRLD